ncbi:major facilitator superfamily domain-containing protein [Xylariales sp. AK1849]|nr:major facilitator superfamily domain-containing protein [Xylariales sp. AK1849]
MTSQPRSMTGDNSAAHTINESSTMQKVPSICSSICSDEKSRVENQQHVFSISKKRICLYIVSLAGLFSPLSSNIYFPATVAIANDLNVSVSLVALTITIYMVVQGLSPSLWGPLSDAKGRRVTYFCTFAVYLVANIGLAFTKNFASLMVLRAIQAAGCAATISIGSGVIGDITTRRERGGFSGTYGGFRQTGQAIGPVLGGLITNYLGFRAIFWFLFGLSSITLLLIATFLPETLRSIAGNGSVQLHGVYKPLIYAIKRQPNLLQERPTEQNPKRFSIISVFSPLRFLCEADVFVTLFFGAIVYAVHSMVTSSTTAMLKPRFKLNDLQIGFVFLPNGVGVIFGAWVMGRLMDRDYKLYEAKHRSKHSIAPDPELDKTALDDFPIEHARLRQSWWHAIIVVLSACSYGYSLHLNHLAAPLALQFLIAYAATAIFTVNSTLIVDLYPGASASATAVNNLVRCLIGAGGVAVIDFVIKEIGDGLGYLICGLVVAAACPLLLLEWRFGAKWRMKRVRRAKDRENKRNNA